MLRALITVLGALTVAACSPAGKDLTPNRPVTETPADYPAGPYGYALGSTIADEQFLGKTPMNGTDVSTIPLQKVDLAQFHRDPAAKALLIKGSAGWCGPCRQEEPGLEMLAEKYEGDGLRVISVIAQGPTYGVTATEADLNAWAQQYDLRHLVVIDPENRLSQYGDLEGFPLHIILRISDMKLVYETLGGDGGLEQAIISSL
jgi:thiol-disulfide isomerase/thioredoxin